MYVCTNTTNKQAFGARLKHLTPNGYAHIVYVRSEYSRQVEVLSLLKQLSTITIPLNM